jgi:hypothetical protein
VDECNKHKAEKRGQVKKGKSEENGRKGETEKKYE